MCVCVSRVLVTAVDCRDTDMKLCFFSNCFFDQFSKGVTNIELNPILHIVTHFIELVWKVARYTSSAPVYFEPGESEGHRFVDGGVKANNPTDYAFTKIQKYLDEQSSALNQGKPVNIYSVHVCCCQVI